MQKNPGVIQSQTSARVGRSQGPKSAQEYLKQLEDLLKRNTGTGTFQGQDISSNLAMVMPGRVSNPTGLGDVAPSLRPQVYNQSAGQNNPVDNPEDISPDEGVQTPVSIEEFLGQFQQAYNAPENQPTAGRFNLRGNASTPDGGTLLSDGTIVYEDGTIRNGSINASGVQSMADGSVLYSDQSVRKKAPQGIASLGGSDRERILYDDGSARYGNFQYGDGQSVQMPGGVRGLISGIFGQDRPITQNYGNINPIEPTPGNVNLGTDIRTRDLSLNDRNFKLPVGAKVMQVYKDDGTRFGDQSGHLGYGNSLLLQLASGEMVRFSHMTTLLDVQPGDTIQAGEVFGTPGTTGNTAGEHLDLEYYDQSGQIQNPSLFSGFSDPQGTRTPLPGQKDPGTLVSPETLSSPGTVQQNTQAQPQYQPSQMYQTAQNAVQAVQPAIEAANDTIKAVRPMSPQRVALGENVNEAGLSLAQKGIGSSIGNSPEGFIGAAELLKGDVSGAGKELSNTIERLNVQPRIDTGLSELLRGDLQGAKQNFSNTTQRVMSRVNALPGDIGRTITPLAQASTNQPQQPQESLAQNFQGAVDSIGQYGNEKTKQLFGIYPSTALSKAGEGVKSLGQSGISSLGNVFSPVQNVVKKAIGDVSGTASVSGGNRASLMDATTSPLAKNDIRDQFFKTGSSESFKDFLKPNADQISGGALTLDVFNNDFYNSPDKVDSVFSGTSLKNDASARSSESVAKQFKEKYANSQYDQSDVQRILRTLPKNLTYSPNLPEPQRAREISLEDYISMGKTPAQWYAETGNQRTADRIQQAGGNLSTLSSDARANYSSPTGQSLYIPPSARKQNNTRPVASGPGQNYTPGNANYSSASGASSYIAPPKQNQSSQQPSARKSTFSNIGSSVRKIFGF